MAEYYSIKMRATRSSNNQNQDQESMQEHISGAERIIQEEKIDEISRFLIHRARNHEKGLPDFINLKIQAIDKDTIQYVPSLPVFMVRVQDHTAAQKACRALLLKAGISAHAIENACAFLENGNQDNRILSGALVIDRVSSSVVNPDGKGIRATTMDFTPAAHDEIDTILAKHNLSGSRLKEALVLATKVANAPYAMAELCYSDNPAYYVGYVAIPGKGYFRIPHLKAPSARGGRVFFIHGDNFSWDNYSRYLKNTPVFINHISPFFLNAVIYEIMSQYEQLNSPGVFYE